MCAAVDVRAPPLLPTETQLPCVSAPSTGTNVYSSAVGAEIYRNLNMSAPSALTLMWISVFQRRWRRNLAPIDAETRANLSIWPDGRQKFVCMVTFQRLRRRSFLKFQLFRLLGNGTCGNVSVSVCLRCVSWCNVICSSAIGAKTCANFNVYAASAPNRE